MKKALNVIGKIFSFLGVTLGMIFIALVLTITLICHGPSESAKELFATTILETGLSNCKHTIKKIDGVNHLFQHCSTGSVVEYQQIEETIAPEVLETITKWINEQQRTIN